MDAEILAAVAAEEAAMTDLLAELVEAPTLLGDEAAGQAVIGGRSPSSDSSRSTSRSTRRRSPATGAAPFGWDVDGKANVLANWEPAGAGDGRSLILNGHIDVVSPEPVVAVERDRRSARASTATGCTGAAPAT